MRNPGCARQAPEQLPTTTADGNSIDQYSKTLATKLRRDLEQLFDLREEAAPEKAPSRAMGRIRTKILRESTDDYLAQIHSALIDGSNTRIAAAHLGAAAYATHR